MTQPTDAAFREEMSELLEQAEANLLALERAGVGEHDGQVGVRCAEQVRELFRVFHTIKGIAAMVGCRDVAGLAHALESILEPVRTRPDLLSRTLMQQALAARDLLAAALQKEHCDMLADALHQMTHELEGNPEPAAPSPLPVENTPGPTPHAVPGWRVVFTPSDPDLLFRLDLLELLRSLVDAGATRLTPIVLGLDLLERIDPTAPLLGWECEFPGSLDENAVRDLFIFVEDVGSLTVTPRAATSPAPSITPASHPESAPLRSAPPPEADRPSGTQGKESRPDSNRVDSNRVDSNRVDSRKLERMVTLVGELVIAQSRLASLSSRIGDGPLQRVVEELDHLSISLRDLTLSLRMVAAGELFGRFRRMVRDLALEQGKDVLLLTQGSETELDKTVLEQLEAPLARLLQHTVHRMETPAGREAAGKPSRGTITLQAAPSAGAVVITLVDDGVSLDREAIAKEALRLGLARDPQSMPDEALYELLFHPELAAVLEAQGAQGEAGCGTGLEQVRRTIDALRGQISLGSRPGQGLAIQIKLPLTLSIIEGLQVRVGVEQFIIPLTMVEECVELRRTIDREDGRDRLVQIRGELVPYVVLRELFAVEGALPAMEHLVVTQAGGVRTGLVVDAVLGQQQAVIKSLGALFRHRAEFAGAAVQGDGTLALILDVPQLVQRQAGQ